jgi:hypothetical protein
MSTYSQLKIADIACKYGVNSIKLRDALIDYQKQAQKNFIPYEDIE